ncbi:UbiD family decarboxylase [Azospirillum sp. RWY-5-1]|uniref:UbiD family decarboxylase n=1 Tax=Azospirillum oleiclasticum TaxID=2735135 RepID=A0ABX2TBS6_9PROT|nr:UbiD family decarboxylase [Azospirillum oleiclasticum]NYZ13437.1 UbiD family decarboxylase [Azospirillum oleiclasticum]NYZ20598.1 UbiD family decarboxylase [Azospirillum oleiclasticum]
MTTTAAAAERRPVTTLRDWLTRLADTDRLAVVKPGVSLRHELAAISKRLDGRKATVFPEPDGHPVPVVSGLVSSRGWIAEAMGVPESALLATFQHACLNPLPSREITDAPVQQVVHREVDLLRQLPVPTHNEHDSGPYVTAGLVITRNPKTGVQNVSINRCQISGPDRIGILILPRHTMAYYRMAEEAGEPLEVAIVVGVDPLTLLASQAIVPLDHDELEIAGALHGAPLDVVQCRTNRVKVPANAEIVIEGRILPQVREPEGPFGEFPQYYGPRDDRHVIQVDAVTHRRGALFHTIVGGALEHLMLGGIPREATLLGHLQRSFTGVRDVHLSLGGVCRYHLVVQIDKRNEGEPRNIMMGAFAGHYDVKQVIVVDKDVDIHNADEVQWAVATRFQADRDLLVVPNALGSKLDPSARDGISAKMGLDCTVPLSAHEMEFKRIRVPGEESVDPAAVVQPDASALLAALLGRNATASEGDSA